MDEAATADDADSNDDTAEQQECHICSCRRAEINHLLKENRRLKEELGQKRLDEDSFKDDDDVKVKYYTGLSCFVVLICVLTQLLPCLPQTGQKLSPFQILLSTLMHQGWGGHVSDKHVTEKSVILNKLLPGDLLLADRGFNVRDSVGLVCAEVKITAFIRGCSQLDAKMWRKQSSPQDSCGEGDWMCKHKVCWLHHTERTKRTSQYGTPMSRWRHDVPGQDRDSMLCLD